LKASPKRTCQRQPRGSVLIQGIRTEKPTSPEVMQCKSKMMGVEFLGASLTGLIAKATFQRPFHRTIRKKVPMPSDSMASDVASQGGGAGPGRAGDRLRRARSAVRAGWRGGPAPQPRDRERSPGARPGGTPQGAAATAAQGSRREAHLMIIWLFLVRISASFADLRVR
jgi:hypothetical protein